MLVKPNTAATYCRADVYASGAYRYVYKRESFEFAVLISMATQHGNDGSNNVLSPPMPAKMAVLCPSSGPPRFVFPGLVVLWGIARSAELTFNARRPSSRHLDTRLRPPAAGIADRLGQRGTTEQSARLSGPSQAVAP